MMKAKEVTLWTLSALAVVLAVASFTGTGTGMWRSGVFTHMLWSYAFGLAIVAVLIWALVKLQETKQPQTPR